MVLIENTVVKTLFLKVSLTLEVKAIKNKSSRTGVVMPHFDPSTPEAQADRFLHLRIAWSRE